MGGFCVNGFVPDRFWKNTPTSSVVLKVNKCAGPSEKLLILITVETYKSYSLFGKRSFSKVRCKSRYDLIVFCSNHEQQSGSIRAGFSFGTRLSNLYVLTVLLPSRLISKNPLHSLSLLRQTWNLKNILSSWSTLIALVTTASAV